MEELEGEGDGIDVDVAVVVVSGVTSSDEDDVVASDGCGGVVCEPVDQGSSPTLVIFLKTFLFTFSFCQTYLTNKITNSYKRAIAEKSLN